jgi:putative hydrolase of the HAD superfamily
MGIEAILFDLGNVLVRFSHDPIARGLAGRARKAPYQDPREVARYLFDAEHGVQNGFDMGRVTPEAYFLSLVREMALDLDFPGFVGIWNPIFQPMPGAERLVCFLGGRVETHLLSNTNALHFPHVLGLFPWLRRMDSWFLSHEMGCRKPSWEIYDRVLRQLGLPPERILYLDDMEANLLPAADRGMRTALVTPHSSLRELIRSFLPDLPWDGFPWG